MEDWQDKILDLGIAVAGFMGVIGIILLLAEGSPRKIRNVVAGLLFAGPALLLMTVGLVLPALDTLRRSFFAQRTESYFDMGAFVGLENYLWAFTDTQGIIAMRNTAIWVVVVPLFSTAMGLLYAILVDRSRFESVAKSLLFMPTAISFVGASIIWKFVYAYRPPEENQIGVANQIRVWLGLEPSQFTLNAPTNTFFLTVVAIWINVGFAMVVLSAAIKAVPNEIVEAARLDGANPWQMFRNVTLPSIRPSVVVVLTTITIGILKVFDIVRTMTGGQFGTSVIANEMYVQAFRNDQAGRGAALAVLIFLFVVPIVVYNVRQLNRTREIR